MATEKLEERMLLAEVRIDEHGNRINLIESKVATIHTDLNELKRILNNIKYWIVGAVSFYVAQEIGVMPLLERLAGL